MLSQTYLDNIDQTIFLYNVVPAWPIQYCKCFFPQDRFPYAKLARVDPDKFVDYFSFQSCLWTVGQHHIRDFLVQG